MLSYDIRELERQAVRVDGSLEPTDPVWSDDDARPASAIQASGRLSRAGSGRYYWSGRIDGTARVAGRRCLADVVAPVSEEVHVLFADASDEVAEESDAFRLPPRTESIDLRPVIREQWLLGAPEYALCREECRGICPRCGADLNAGSCGCALETDSRWDAVRATRHAAE